MLVTSLPRLPLNTICLQFVWLSLLQFPCIVPKSIYGYIKETAGLFFYLSMSAIPIIAKCIIHNPVMQTLVDCERIWLCISFGVIAESRWDFCKPDRTQFAYHLPRSSRLILNGEKIISALSQSATDGKRHSKMRIWGSMVDFVFVCKYSGSVSTIIRDKLTFPDWYSKGWTQPHHKYLLQLSENWGKLPELSGVNWR